MNATFSPLDLVIPIVGCAVLIVMYALTLGPPDRTTKILAGGTLILAALSIGLLLHT